MRRIVRRSSSAGVGPGLIALPLAFVVLGCHGSGLVSAGADSDAEMVDAVNAALQQQTDAWNRWDLEAFLATYDPQLKFASEGRLLHGRTQLETRYRSNYRPERRGVLSFDEIEIERLGPTAALAIGRYHLQREGETAPRPLLAGVPSQGRRLDHRARPQLGGGTPRPCRRRRKRVMTISWLLFALAGFPAIVDASPPNVVLIISDDQAWTDFGFMGHPRVRTPHLDRLAARGVLFPRGYVPSSLCRTSLATIVSGLYPHQHKITGQRPARRASRRASGCSRTSKRITTVPEPARGARATAACRPASGGRANVTCGGFTEGMTHGDPVARRPPRGCEGLKIGRDSMEPIALVHRRMRRDRHALLPCGTRRSCHTRPHNPPERILLARYRDPEVPDPRIAQATRRCATWFDETCGELLAHLDERGITERTLVIVFVIDNGWIQREDSPAYAPRSKRSPYDGGIRTPIILAGAGIESARRVAVPVSSVDIAPTVLHACGFPAHPRMPGRDLVALAASEAPELRPVFGATFSHDVADLDRPTAGLQFRWIVDGAWKLLVPAAGGAPSLFAIEEDPFERKDLAASRAAEVAALRERLDAWWSGDGR